MALLFLFIHSLYTTEPPSIVSFDPQYLRAFKTANPQIRTTECIPTSPLRFLQDNQNINVFESQALPITHAVSKYTFSPHYEQTIIIAVDRNQTNEKITSWDDILQSTLPINFSFGKPIATMAWNTPQMRQIIATMSQALYDSYNIKAIAKDFQRLYANKRFFTNDNTIPLSVMYDSEAVALIKEGRNLEIVFPSEGTFSFTAGLLHNSTMKFDSKSLNAALIDAGFRLPTGEANELYPPREMYKTASKIEDYTTYNRAIAAIDPIMRRDSFSVKKYGFADNKERTLAYVICIIVVIVYLISVFFRISQKNIRNSLIIICILELLLATTQFMKAINMNNSNLETFLWYAFYFPFVMVPTVFVYIAIITGKEYQSRKSNIAFTWYFIVSFLPILFVATNNIHGQVFIIHDYYNTYFSYNWGYYLVMSWIYGSIIFALTTLIYKAFHSPRKYSFLFPIAAGILTLLYTVGIVLRIPIARDFDVGYGTGIAILLFAEACIQSKLFPVNKGYTALFLHSRLRMEIIDIYNNTILKSNYDYEPDSHLKLKRNSIRGGSFLYFEDYTAFNKIALELTRQNDLQEKNNTLLEKKGKTEANLIALSVQKEVYSTINDILERDTKKIYLILDDMKNTKNNLTNIARINMIACGIKRECVLRINTLHKENQILDDFLNYIHEMSQFVVSIPLKITINSTIKGSIPIYQALFMYEVFRSAIEQAVCLSCDSILIQLYEKSNSTIFSIIANKDIFTHINLEKLQDSASALSATLIAKPWDETKALLLSFSKREEKVC